MKIISSKAFNQQNNIPKHKLNQGKAESWKEDIGKAQVINKALAIKGRYNLKLPPIVEMHIPTP